MPFILIIVAVFFLWVFLRYVFKPGKPAPKHPQPARKAAPPVDPNLESDPNWLSVSRIGGPLAQPNQPLYASCADRVVALVQENIPQFRVLYYERPRKRDVEVPGDLAALPRHSGYKPGQCVAVIDDNGKVYCIDLFTYNITDQNRLNFCKRLAQKLGCGCKLYTAQLPNTKGEIVERVLGCVIAKAIDQAEEEKPNRKEPQVIATEDDIDPIPVTVQTYEWEEIDEEE